MHFLLLSIMLVLNVLSLWYIKISKLLLANISWKLLKCPSHFMYLYLYTISHRWILIGDLQRNGKFWTFLRHRNMKFDEKRNKIFFMLFTIYGKQRLFCFEIFRCQQLWLRLLTMAANWWKKENETQKIEHKRSNSINKVVIQYTHDPKVVKRGSHPEVFWEIHLL